MKTVLYSIDLLVAIVLIALLVLQARGGGLGGIFGGWGAPTFRTRRGIERTLFRLTIILAAVFVIIAMITVGVVR
jgi:preprotein translocase subunit SecG